jgi:hypothetical protein
MVASATRYFGANCGTDDYYGRHAMKEEIMPSQALVDFEVKKPNGTEMALVPASPTPMELLQIAVSKDLSIEKIAQLMELQLEWEANEARKAFVQAMNAFKANPPQILKNKHVKFGQTEYDHATLDHVCRAAMEGLSKVGISHRWNVTQSDGLIHVTCVLTHEQGHSEETTLSGPADSSGSKNAIQAIGSAVTYLQRYTLLAATGLAAGNDNDAASPTFGELNERLEWIANCATLEELQRVFAAAYKEAKASGSNGALQALANAKDKKKRELQ